MHIKKISYRSWKPAKMQKFAISGIKTPEKFQFLKPKTLDSTNKQFRAQNLENNEKICRSFEL